MPLSLRKKRLLEARRTAFLLLLQNVTLFDWLRTSMEDVGTPAFMAPEQHLLKKGSRSFDATAEVDGANPLKSSR